MLAALVVAMRVRSREARRVVDQMQRGVRFIRSTRPFLSHTISMQHIFIIYYFDK